MGDLSMEQKGFLTGVISDIQKFSVHDGPGIRTIVFFKGCPLRCQWCQNPETWQVKPQIMYTINACIRCGACQAMCPQGVITLTDQGVQIDRNQCNVCQTCLETCYAEALSCVGKTVEVSRVLETVLDDMAFYGDKGGITLSGGEVLMQADFATALLRGAKEHGVHTAIETCGFGNWDDLCKMLPYLDLVLFDVKHTDSAKHRQYTGVGNERILANLKRLGETGKEVIIRVPYIPGVNDSAENIRATGELARSVHAKMVHLLPFHKMGEAKWVGLGQEYTFADAELPEQEQINPSATILEEMGIRVNIGGYQY